MPTGNSALPMTVSIVLQIAVSHIAVLQPTVLRAQQPASKSQTDVNQDKSDRPVRLSPTAEIWVDRKNKTVIVGGKICLRQGQLEMFACPEGTKEHESIVAMNCKASLIHAGLIAVGAKPGKPVQYDPKYVPASGSVIDVYVLWTDDKDKQHRVRAQQMIRHVATGKSMDHNWVFAGSMFWKDPDNGDQHYLADGGEAICVSNFSSALLDLDVESPQQNANLLFDALPEKIPPLGTKVKLHLVPRPAKKPAAS